MLSFTKSKLQSWKGHNKIMLKHCLFVCVYKHKIGKIKWVFICISKESIYIYISFIKTYFPLMKI